MARAAVIDIGSNTMRLEIIELDGENVISLLYQRKTAGLAGYISQGVMSREGVNVLLGVLGNFHVLIQLAQVQAVHCLATASLRVLKNASVVLAEIKEKFGLDVRVLTGDEEALVSFAGSRDLMDDRPSLFVDLGGGSTELVRVERRGPVRSVSLPFGALVLYHRFIRGILPTEAERDQMELFLEESFRQVDWLPGLKAVYAIGGTALAAGRLRSHYLRSEAAITHGSRFSAAEYALMLRHMDQDADAAKVLVKVLPERLYLINPGLSVFRCLIAATGAEEFCISRKGLRKGYIQILRERGGL